MSCLLCTCVNVFVPQREERDRDREREGLREMTAHLRESHKHAGKDETPLGHHTRVALSEKTKKY